MPSVNIGETPIANLDEPIAKSNSLWLTNRSFEDLEVHSRSSERPPVVSPIIAVFFRSVEAMEKWAPL